VVHNAATAPVNEVCCLPSGAWVCREIPLQSTRSATPGSASNHPSPHHLRDSHTLRSAVIPSKHRQDRLHLAGKGVHEFACCSWLSDELRSGACIHDRPGERQRTHQASEQQQHLLRPFIAPLAPHSQAQRSQRRPTKAKGKD
jgi:hypothetical protein